MADNSRGKVSDKVVVQRHVFIIGDREIIGSTPKNPVIMRTGG